VAAPAWLAEHGVGQAGAGDVDEDEHDPGKLGDLRLLRGVPPMMMAVMT
jgi:hypothetical protein